MIIHVIWVIPIAYYVTAKRRVVAAILAVVTVLIMDAAEFK